MDYAYRDMALADLERLRDIDRSEHITTAYAMDGDRLVSQDVDWEVPAWHDGTGDHSFGYHIDFCRGHLERGAQALGCFMPGETLVGIGLMTPEVEPGVAQLAYLHVSHDHRGRGIGRELVERLTAGPATAGAVEIHVSASPDESTVSFYQGLGFRITDRPNAALLALEPEDIHLRRPS